MGEGDGTLVTADTQGLKPRYSSTLNAALKGRSSTISCRLFQRFIARYSSTLSSSFFLPQSAAAWTKARTIGCGFFSVDASCGWKSVAK